MRSLNTGKNLLHWLANVDEDGIAWLRLQTDGKSVNVLTHAVMAELESLVDQLEASEDLTGVAMLSGKPGGFVYGADIHEFETLKTADNVANHMLFVHRLFNRIEALPVPSCVGVDGIAVAVGWKLRWSLTVYLLPHLQKQSWAFPRLILALCQAMAAAGGPTAGLAQKLYWT